MPRSAAYVCPTMNRQELHPELHATFAAQTLARKGLARLYVLDESARPSSYFSRIKDAAVTYVHRVATPRIDGVTRIGESRNAINALVREPYVLHTDDDDWMDPLYGERLLERLGDAALAKLDVWRCWTEALGDGVIFEWDTRKPVGGEHWALRGDDVEKTVVDPSEMPADVAARTNDAWRVGFGFSYAYPISSWHRHKFPTEGTEDIAFARAIRESGGKIVFISDLAHLILHRVSARSLSVHFPQRIVEGAQRLLGAAGSPEQQLRAWLSQRMMGAGASMNPLPDGQAIQIVPGQTYSVLASLKDAHSLRSLSTRASQWGVTVSEARDNVSPAEFGVPAPAKGYRLVHAIASSSKPGVLPWKVPAPISVFDKSRIVKAWTSQAVGAGRPLSGGDPAMALVTGAGHLSGVTLGPRGIEEISEGTKAIGAADIVERYDPKRYAGKVPPHVCSIASSTAIAQQIPGAPYVFERAVPNGGDFGWKVTSTGSSVERVFPVTTPMGKKNIPVQMVHIEGQPNRVILTCPYTGQHFAFQQKSTMGAGRPLGAGAPSLGQLGLNAAGNGSLSFASDYVNSQVDPSGTASSAGAGAIATAGGWSNMTEQQQTQYGEGVVTAIAGVALPGAGAVIAQLIFSAVGTAGSGPGCTCPNCPQPFSPLPPLSSATPGNSGSFQSMCNTTGLREWATDAMCSGYKLAGWNSPASSFAAWIGMVATNAVAWDSATATDGPGMYDVDGVTGLSGAPMQNGALQTPGPTVPPGKLLIVRTVQATSPDPAMAGYSGAAFGDVIGVALDYMASVANGNDGSFTWTSNGSVPPNTQVSLLVNNGKTLSPAQIEKGGGPVYSPGLGFKGSPGLKIVGASVAVVALAAGGYSLWALLAGQAQSEAWSRLFKGIAGESQKSGQLLLSAGPKALGGAGETKRKKKRKSTNVQTLLFPRSQFSPSKARAWAARHGYSSGYVDTPPTGDYHRIRQQTPLRNGTLRTISLGGSGVKAVVQRAT